MFGNINAKQIEKVMKQMGMSQTSLDVKRVVFERSDGEPNLVIDEPSVTKIVMQGQETYQVQGEAREEETSAFSDDDVKMVIEKTGKDEEKVRKILEEKNGDIAEAILELSN